MKQRDEQLQKRLLELEAQAAGLQATAKEIQNNRATRLAEGLARMRMLLRKKERASFFAWLRGGASDARYQPLCQIERQAAQLKAQLEELAQSLEPQAQPVAVVFLGTIDFDFLTQRPQHLAMRLADRGYPVYYVNAEFGAANHLVGKVHISAPGQRIAPNLYACLDDASQKALYQWLKTEVEGIAALTETERLVVVNQHPLWQPAALAIRKEKNAFLIADYMDDYLDFPDMDPRVRPFAGQMLQTSDLVVVTSLFLQEKARQNGAPRVELLRNGTDCSHFAQARRAVGPAERKRVVGYYGVLSAWFDCAKIEALSKSDLDITIRLVGVATEEARKKLCGLANVELLEAVPYARLPEVLREFDVCMIPFKADTDLIRATNPVKFYEYLSAGKKVVATEIMELLPYRNQYAYCENDDQAFVEKVRLCLMGQDELEGPEACAAFAQENDWNQRAEQLEQWIRQAVGEMIESERNNAVSVIV